MANFLRCSPIDRNSHFYKSYLLLMSKTDSFVHDRVEYIILRKPLRLVINVCDPPNVKFGIFRNGLNEFAIACLNSNAIIAGTIQAPHSLRF